MDDLHWGVALGVARRVCGERLKRPAVGSPGDREAHCVEEIVAVARAEAATVRGRVVDALGDEALVGLASVAVPVKDVEARFDVLVVGLRGRDRTVAEAGEADLRVGLADDPVGVGVLGEEDVGVADLREDVPRLRGERAVGPGLDAALRRGVGRRVERGVRGREEDAAALAPEDLAGADVAGAPAAFGETDRDIDEDGRGAAVGVPDGEERGMEAGVPTVRVADGGDPAVRAPVDADGHGGVGCGGHTPGNAAERQEPAGRAHRSYVCAFDVRASSMASRHGTDDGEALSDALKERAMDEAPVGITMTDPTRPDNPLVYVNDAFERITGYEREGILGRNCRFLQGPETATERVDVLRRAVETGESAVVELRNYRADGEVFWNEVKVAPIRDDAGDVRYFVGFQRDVTERKRSELAVRRERANLDHLLNRVDGLLSDVTEAVVSAESREAIERQVCERLAAAETYAFAWLGAADLVDGVVRPRARAGGSVDADASPSPTTWTTTRSSGRLTRERLRSATAGRVSRRNSRMPPAGSRRSRCATAGRRTGC
ncbi:sensory transduction histidine kinase [Halarchaeum acidiphilum MH1-52-1]|uniref:Sensory transduction histidine kinase n=2 Tax=Halarchaeum acidiphilum TaxID=489138 RepID=U3AC91_9EURY|nr:sensory transduction histidine kinase [Halarchaeum acidiphilum MH1-52-1]